MSSKRKPAARWYRAVLVSEVAEIPVLARNTDDHHWVLIAEDHAPDRCFEPAETAEPDALKVGERVYVSNPAGALAACRIEGWGRIQDVSKDTATVLFDREWVGHADPHRTWHVFLAACHREGSQSEPPNPEAVFLGRYFFSGSNSVRDLWWSKAEIGFIGGLTWFTPQEVDGLDLDPANDNWRTALARARALGLVPEAAPLAEPDQDIDHVIPLDMDAKPSPNAIFLCIVDTPANQRYAWFLPKDRAIRIHACAWPVDTILRRLSTIASGWRAAYNTALSRASELGLVPEAEKPEGSQADMMGLEPKFQMGQAAEWGHADSPHVLRLTSEARWDDDLTTWAYDAVGLRAEDSICAAQELADADADRPSKYDLRPHTMSVADVPDEVLVAILRGEPVRVVDMPVNHEGLPYSEELGLGEGDWPLRGQRAAVRQIHVYEAADEPPLAVLADGKSVWLWNFELAPDA